jgi:succinate dehydrogenase / fumarate reductase cytochrome b subunit
MNGYTHGSGIFAWLAGGRRGFEAYLYILHRISGLALLLFLVAHVFVTSSRLLGEEVWEKVMATTHHPLMAFFEYLVFAAFVFHGLNGLRLVLVELGFAVGKPDRPVYPYKSSLDSQRTLMVVLMIITGLLIALGGFELLRFPG